VNALNPKTALFVLAFLPQFVDPADGAVAPQMLVLGVLFLTLATLSDGTYALLASHAGGKLRAFAGSSRLLDRLSGGVFVGLGVAAALSGEPKTRSS
jgi:threonine/homoserine/homoserine lactone efflux protein